MSAAANHALLNTQPVQPGQLTSPATSSLGRQTQQSQQTQVKQSTTSRTVFATIDERAKSPNTVSRHKQRTNQGSSLVRRFNALDQGTRAAINESFLQNVKTGKNQITVQEALQEFYGKDVQAK